MSIRASHDVIESAFVENPFRSSHDRGRYKRKAALESPQAGHIRVFDRSFIPITPPFIEFDRKRGTEYFVHREDAPDFVGELKYLDAVAISPDLFDVLRIEAGTPSYGIDMDETTIVPELGLDGMISYNKGCYIGQEIIARIHFRGHVAKRLTGLMMHEPGDTTFSETELTTADGRNAGRVTSSTFSAGLNRTIALAYVRYDYLEAGTELMLGDDKVMVCNLPFIERVSDAGA